ncbi:tetratricopeptide repeat protein [Acidipila sp. EB88]|uniref:tetratricopeptide repeat protein n=1 Tax=Acidipila sp. EB88 TaxID=2305226 RepID=UPI0021031AC4|nr:tetratricopeptide repeat protein [Acidipila sp. EB88]
MTWYKKSPPGRTSANDQLLCAGAHIERKVKRLVVCASALASVLIATAGAQQPLPSLSAQASARSRAEAAMRAQDTPAAMREYRAILAADPRDSEAWTGLGVLLYGSGQAAEAVAALHHALELDPAAPHAALFLSLSEAQLRECDLALPALSSNFQALPAGKLQRLTGLTLLQCSLQIKDASAALQAAATLQQRYPDDADVLYESAELYTRMWSDAANTLMTKHPESYRVHELAGEVNEAQGNIGQAIREYRLALIENPKLPQLHYRVGQLLLKEGAPDADEKAMTEFRAELGDNPQSSVAALAMAEIDRHNGRLAEAASGYALAQRLEPGLVEAQTGMAETLLAQHKVDDAQAQLQKIITDHPENARAHYAMMLCYRAEAKLPEASREMAEFERLQRNTATMFQDRLHALLTGSSNAAPADVARP